MIRNFTSIRFCQIKQISGGLIIPNELIKVDNSGLMSRYLDLRLPGYFRLLICILLLCQLHEAVSQATAGTINLSTSTISSGICGASGNSNLDLSIISNGASGACNGVSNCSGTNYLWQTSTNGLTWSSASGTNNGATYNPPSVSTITYFRRLFTSPSTDIASNVVTIDPALSNSGSISWDGGISCTKRSTLTLNSSGVSSNPLQYSWQTTSISNPVSNICLTCSNIGTFDQVSGTGDASSTSLRWSFTPPPTGVYCKRLTFAIRTADLIKCYTTSSAAESSYTNSNAGTDGTMSVSTAQTVTLRNVISSEDGGGSWTRISGTNGTYTSNGENASFTVTQGTSHMNVFRYIINAGSACCADTSFASINVIRSLNLDNATFDVKLKSENEAELSLKDENIKLGGRFEIERNIQGENAFSTIDEVNVNPIGLSEFKYLDKLPNSAKIVNYRIKNVSLDGSITYTAIKQVTRKIKTLIDIYPSLVSQDIKLQVQNESEGGNSVQIRIYDMVGRSLKSENVPLHKGYNAINLNLQMLIQGNYFLRVVDQTDRINETFKFVKRD